VKSEELRTKKVCGRSVVSAGLPGVYYLLILVFFLSFSCGKKGPPTLKAYEKPEKPSGLTAVHREDGIVLKWSYPDGLRPSIKGFQVLRSEGKGFEREMFVKSDQDSFADNDFRLNVTYEYKVVAQNLKDILSDDSDIVRVTPASLPPPPEDIRVTIRTDSVELAWDSSGEGVCYNVFRRPERGKYGGTPLNAEPDCSTSFKDDFLSLESPVYYTVRALHNTPSRDEGYPSREIEVSPSNFIPTPPSDIRVVKTQGKIYITWKESPEMWVKGYRVYRKLEEEKDFVLLGEVKTPAFTDEGKPGRRTWYMIRAEGPLSESEPLRVEVR
jgi:hypothetical protein